MRQSFSRSHKSKGGGFRVKHVLQICLLLAICTWLLYQIKHSHDKKRAFESNISKTTMKTSTLKQSDFFDFGRKGLPLIKENDSAMHHADDDNEEGREEEEEGGQRDQDMRHEEDWKEEVKREEDDLFDDPDQRGGDEENELEDEFSMEEERNGQVEVDSSAENNSNDREDYFQEAREENYKRDDASSAVAHDSHPVDMSGSVEEQDIEDSRPDNSEIAGNAMEDMNNATPASKASNVGFEENTTATKDYVPLIGSHSENKLLEVEVEVLKPENDSRMSLSSIEVGNQNELQQNNTAATSLPKNSAETTAVPLANVSDISSAIQNSSAGEIPRLKSSGLISSQGQNYSPVVNHNEKSDASEEHKSEVKDQSLSFTMNENGSKTTVETDTTATEEDGGARNDLSAVQVTQNEVKHADSEVTE